MSSNNNLALKTCTRHILRILTAAAVLFTAGSRYAFSQDAYSLLSCGHLDRARPLFRQDTVEICIVGDVMMHARQLSEAAAGNGRFDFGSYFSLIADRIRKADIAVANMEFTLAGKPYTGYPCFSAPDNIVAYAAETGFNVFLAANNHICDKGEKGMRRTISVYRQMEKEGKIRFTGIAEDAEAQQGNYPLTIRKKGISVALVNFTYGTNCTAGCEWPKVNMMNDTESLEEAMRKAEPADFTIVLPHWGTEYSHRCSPQQEKTAEWLVSNGADLIIGTHPHVVQNRSDIHADGRIVPAVFSLGNAVSNMSAPGTQLELMANVKIIRDWTGDIRMGGLELTYLWCSRPGGYGRTFTVIPVAEFVGRRAEWTGEYDYDKMIYTYKKVMQETGIMDSSCTDNGE